MTRSNRSTSKESMAKLFNRYVWLIDVIYRAGDGGITFKEIARRWLDSVLNPFGDELPIKTFDNHRKAIEEMFDINIGCRTRGGYHYYIEDTGDTKRDGVRQWLVNTLSINNIYRETEHIKDKIIFENIPGGQQYLAPIIEALRDSVSIEMAYQSYRNDTPHTIEVAPYCIKLFKQRWYLVAYNDSLGDVRIYALDRIQSAQVTTRGVIPPADFSAERYFESLFGVVNEGDVETLEIKVLRANLKDRYITSLPLHPSQELIEECDDHIKLRYQMKLTIDLRQELTLHGADIEVLRPKWFRDEIAEVFRRAAGVYGG